MRSNVRNFCFFLLVVMSCAASARAELNASLKIGDQVLQLNGAGVRTKTFFGIWLSDSPVDKDLRQAMLSGNKAAR